ncbi:hypothetical protein LTR91_020205 [Friedmanniomyces endolithicus]|uniref:DUF7730 domain-containing protein n=1 Tax=Friedmanniomyces endolithicus TaxID=329885 RepID=A0AAN6HAG9_9PEZI|nr:hypothetical protein LTR94_019477 [Friedmanniomyces endolithicus]KAK0774437.1 hypothetical protein LTR59_014876 [Friedmanniomyces endolithicus]KAK0802626.1 hypothetical protein LTR75_008197 [Friedmanniomyces endolithicus]KAK0807952.1 hypothetical protein LTR38_004769 [Friedmanniomyces endolithicus]KAK0834122.1 hypothetical protein LTR03_014585 [Friedmanniomyces endolithicus]
MAKRKAGSVASSDVELPKKRTPRLKVLSTSSRTSEQQAIYEANAANSPLLKLPPEIRNRIWHLVLGGRTIHISSSSVMGRRRRFYSVCQVPGSDDESAKKIKQHNALSGDAEGFESHRRRHDACQISQSTATTDYASQSSLNVLRTCRQAHEEGALLPFKLNDFDFHSFAHLVPFLQGLFQAQAHAIEMITLACFAPHTTLTLARLVKTRLKGLRQLRCFVEVNIYGTSLPVFRPSWSKALSQFNGLAITSATVLAYNGFSGLMRSPPAGCSREVMRDWAKETEDGLLVAAE